MNTSEFLIFSTERSGQQILTVIDNEPRRVQLAYWFMPRERGYTPDINAAGRFSSKRGVEIITESRGNDFPVDAQLFVENTKDSFHLIKGPDGLSIVDLNDEYNIEILNGYRDLAKYLET